MQLIDDGFIDEDSVDMNELNDSKFGILYNLKYNTNRISFLEYSFSFINNKTLTGEITGKDSLRRIIVEDLISISDDGSYYIVGDLKFLRDEYEKLEDLTVSSGIIYIYYDSDTDDSDIITKYITSNELMW